MSNSLVIQKPATRAGQLMLLFHGVGASAAQMAPLGRRIAAEYPDAFIVSVDGPMESDLGAGRQWFSVRDVTDANRALRAQAAMPGFLEAVSHWQSEAGVDAEGTTLIGFSQGAIMALESTRQMNVPCGRVVAISGQFGSRDPSSPHGHGRAATGCPRRRSHRRCNFICRS